MRKSSWPVLSTHRCRKSSSAPSVFCDLCQASRLSESSEYLLILRLTLVFVEPLIRLWREALRQATAEFPSPDRQLSASLMKPPLTFKLAATRLFAVFLDALNAVIDEAQAAAQPSLPALALLPSLGTSET